MLVTYLQDEADDVDREKECEHHEVGYVRHFLSFVWYGGKVAWGSHCYISTALYQYLHQQTIRGAI